MTRLQRRLHLWIWFTVGPIAVLAALLTLRASTASNADAAPAQESAK